MQPTLPLAISFSLLLAPVYGQEMKVGQMVIAIENADLQTADGSTVNVYPGLSLTIQEMEVVATEQGTTKTRILVSYRRLGWLDKQAVRLPDDALKFFELQSEQKPDRAVWKIASGMTLAATGKHEPAIVVLSKVLESNPDSISALNERAFSLMQLGQYERATKDFDSLIEKQPQAIFYNNRALCHQASNDLVAAKHDFAKALELDTKLVHLHMPLASIETGLGNLDAAMEHLDKYIEHFPHLTSGYLERGKIHMSRGDIVATAKEYELACQADPDDADLQRVHGLILKEAGKMDKAFEVFTKLIQQFPESFPGHINRAILYEDSEQYELALVDYNRALELTPQSAFGFFHRGCVQIELKNYPAAVADITHAIEISPQTEAFERRGEAYALSNENTLAIEDFDRALAEDPNRHFARYRRGTVYQLIGEPDKALEDYSYLVEAGIHSRDVFYNRGRIFNQQKQWKQSIADWEQAEKMDSNSLLIVNDLAWILATVPDERERNPERSIELATRACELTQWELGASLDTLATAYAANGDFEQAIEWQEKALQKNDTKDNSEVKARLLLFKEKKAFIQAQ